ncbi:MAG: tRNA (N(6)-L-threonylcarbamoyladenosine(37)-C(2))-methylthiotransferase MtaB [Myxococcales bacterium]|nr:tRNA (N(6)-L-threonylcarbamoyladenosine(37)-C(2))-methylthiotransferase MtaB [Myxococcales bacterium]
MRVAITSHGCRLNHFEGDAMGRLAAEAGHELVDLAADPEVVVVNTCTITHDADADARQAIRRIARRWPGARIVATGCYANGDPAALEALPGVAAVVGNREKGRWLEHIEQAQPGVVDVAVGDLSRRVRLARLRPAIERRRSRALLKIQDGCNYRCAFCIVPQVRGRSTSVEPERLVLQLRELVDAGAPEVVLTGVHLGTYGWDLRPRGGLLGLLRRLHAEVPAARLRLGSLDPHELDDPLLDHLAAEPRICRHLHLPVQSGDAEVLRRMRRVHRVHEIERQVPRAVAAIPGVAIGTDIIVGFPGEDERAFANTYGLVEALPIAYAHVFSYSIRAGTEAAAMADQVEPGVKAARSERLRGLSRRKWAAFARAAIGTRAPAVVHRSRDRRSGDLVALTDNYLRVRVPGEDALFGRPVEVEVQGVDDDGRAFGAVVAS